MAQTPPAMAASVKRQTSSRLAVDQSMMRLSMAAQSLPGVMCPLCWFTGTLFLVVSLAGFTPAFGAAGVAMSIPGMLGAGAAPVFGAAAAGFTPDFGAVAAVMSMPGMLPMPPSREPRFDSASTRNVAEATTVSRSEEHTSELQSRLH